MDIQLCQHGSSENCQCEILVDDSLILPKRYLSDVTPRQKRISPIEAKRNFNYTSCCQCISPDNCECPIYPQCCHINTHQYQTLVKIPQKYRVGLKRIFTFIQYHDMLRSHQTLIIPTIPSEFTPKYLETKDWFLRLRAFCVPHNSHKKVSLYVLMDSDSSGWFEINLTIYAKMPLSSCFCPKCSHIYHRDTHSTDDILLPLNVLPLSTLVTSMNLYSLLHPDKFHSDGLTTLLKSAQVFP